MGEPRVRVRVRRTGGFAAVPLLAEVDSADLGRADADRLRTLVARAELQTQPPTGHVPDALLYEIDVWRDGMHRHLTVRDPGVPPRLRELLTWLERASGRGRSASG